MKRFFWHSWAAFLGITVLDRLCPNAGHITNISLGCLILALAKIADHGEDW
jgi:hypothetical protein